VHAQSLEHSGPIFKRRGEARVLPYRFVQKIECFGQPVTADEALRHSVPFSL
jgi:hypothetical protein